MILGDDALEYLPSASVPVEQPSDLNFRPCSTTPPRPTLRLAWPDPLSPSRDELAELDMILPGVVVLLVLHGRGSSARRWSAAAIEKFSPAAIAVELPAGIGEPPRPRDRSPAARFSALEVPNEEPSTGARSTWWSSPRIAADRGGARARPSSGSPFTSSTREVADHPLARDRPRSTSPAPSLARRRRLAARALLAAASRAARAPPPTTRARTSWLASVAALALRVRTCFDAAVLVVCGLHHAPGPVVRLGPLLAEGAAPPAPLRRLTRREGHVLWHPSEQSSAEGGGGGASASRPSSRPGGYERQPRQRPALGAEPGERRRGARPAHRGRARPRSRTRSARPRRPIRTTSGRGSPGAPACCWRSASRRGRATASAPAAIFRPGAILRLLALRPRLRRARKGRSRLDLYQLVVAARGFVDDTYAQEGLGGRDGLSVAGGAASTCRRSTPPPRDLPRPRARRSTSTRSLGAAAASADEDRRGRERRSGAGRVGRTFHAATASVRILPEDPAPEHYGAFLRKRTERGAVRRAHSGRAVLDQPVRRRRRPRRPCGTGTRARSTSASSSSCAASRARSW